MAQNIRKAFASPLFLSASILLTVMCVVSFNIFTLLFTIGAWVAYKNAKSDNEEMNTSGIKLISGTAKVYRIIALVLSIILAVTFFALVIALVIAGPAVAETFDEGIEAFLQYDNFNVFLYDSIGLHLEDFNVVRGSYETFCDGILNLSQVMGMSLGVMYCIFLIAILAVLGVFFVIFFVFSLTFFKTATNFISTVEQSTQDDGPVIGAKKLKIWCLVVGILLGIAGLETVSLVGGVLVLVEPALLIVVFAWINKYFK